MSKWCVGDSDVEKCGAAGQGCNDGANGGGAGSRWTGNAPSSTPGGETTQRCWQEGVAGWIRGSLREGGLEPSVLRRPCSNQKYTVRRPGSTLSPDGSWSKVQAGGAEGWWLVRLEECGGVQADADSLSAIVDAARQGQLKGTSLATSAVGVARTLEWSRTS